MGPVLESTPSLHNLALSEGIEPSPLASETSARPSSCESLACLEGIEPTISRFVAGRFSNQAAGTKLLFVVTLAYELVTSQSPNQAIQHGGWKR